MSIKLDMSLEEQVSNLQEDVAVLRRELAVLKDRMESTSEPMDVDHKTWPNVWSW